MVGSVSLLLFLGDRLSYRSQDKIRVQEIDQEQDGQPQRKANAGPPPITYWWSDRALASTSSPPVPPHLIPLTVLPWKAGQTGSSTATRKPRSRMGLTPAAQAQKTQGYKAMGAYESWVRQHWPRVLWKLIPPLMSTPRSTMPLPV